MSAKGKSARVELEPTEKAATEFIENKVNTKMVYNGKDPKDVVSRVYPEGNEDDDINDDDYGFDNDCLKEYIKSYVDGCQLSPDSDLDAFIK